MKISNVDSFNTLGAGVRASTSLENVDSSVQPLEAEVDVTNPIEKQGEVIDDEMIEKAVEQANKSLENYNRYIERSVHEKTKAIMYVMKDTKTNEIIREFPPKKIQDMIAKMWELAGLFVDEKA